MATRLDPGSPLPYYHQLKQILQERVRSEGLSEGDRIWSDHELMAEFSVSRSVVRQALAELESEGVVERVKGKGTFLSHTRMDHGLALSLQGLHQHARLAGLDLVSDVLRQEIAPADESLAARLGIDDGAPVFVLERCRHVDGEPWARTTSWLPSSLVPGIEKIDFRTGSLYACLAERYGITIVHATRSIEAIAAPPEIAESLQVAEGAPLLRLRSTSLDAQGRVVETFTAHHRGDRSRFDVSLGDNGTEAALKLHG